MNERIEIRRWDNNEIIYSHECENNSIKLTLEKGVKEGVSFAYAYLSNANLSNAYLSNAYLSNANLSYANLYNANLSNAYLRHANLSNANLSNAFMPIYCKWTFGIKNDNIKIGCEERSIAEWDEFFESNEFIKTERGTEEFKQIEAVYKACKAYLEHLKS